MIAVLSVLWTAIQVIAAIAFVLALAIPSHDERYEDGRLEYRS